MDKAEANARLDELFLEVDAVLGSSDPEHVRAHAYRLLREVSSHERGGDEPGEEDPAARLVREAQEVLESHEGMRMTVEQVAVACCVSATTLKQAFRSACGMSPGAWFRARRIDQAQRLLMETDLSVAQVAASVGYANPSKFSHAFKAQTGETPTAWRDLHQ